MASERMRGEILNQKMQPLSFLSLSSFLPSFSLFFYRTQGSIDSSFASVSRASPICFSCVSVAPGFCFLGFFSRRVRRAKEKKKTLALSLGPLFVILLTFPPFLSLSLSLSLSSHRRRPSRGRRAAPRPQRATPRPSRRRTSGGAARPGMKRGEGAAGQRRSPSFSFISLPLLRSEMGGSGRNRSRGTGGKEARGQEKEVEEVEEEREWRNGGEEKTRQRRSHSSPLSDFTRAKAFKNARSREPPRDQPRSARHNHLPVVYRRGIRLDVAVRDLCARGRERGPER